MALEGIEKLAQQRIAGEYQQMLPALTVEIEGMKKALVNSVMSDLTSNRLTPEIALEKWVEYAALVRLLQKFESRVRMGEQK